MPGFLSPKLNSSVLFIEKYTNAQRNRFIVLLLRLQGCCKSGLGKVMIVCMQGQ